MTPQEAQMLQDLVRKVEGTQLTEKDSDAAALLNDGLARDPDALYKLAQTVLIQNIALEQARAQMQRMQQQLAPGQATSFLGGAARPNQPPYAPPPPPPRDVPPPEYAYQPAPSSGGGGFLRSAAGTAVGVAGGILAFEGIESLLHGGMGGGYGGFGEGPHETVIDNYYEDPQQAADPNAYVAGPDQQPQGPYDASADVGGPDEQPQGPSDDERGDDPGDAQVYLDDSGGGDIGGDPGGDPGGGDFGGGDQAGTRDFQADPLCTSRARGRSRNRQRRPSTTAS